MSTRKRVAWPGVAAKTAKGRTYYYWKRSEPWLRLPDPIDEPDAFMRRLAHLQRLEIRNQEARAGTYEDAERLYRKSPSFTDRAPRTRETYSIYLDELLELFGQAPLRDITRADVQRLVMDENADRRGAANMMLAAMHIVFKWAMGRHEGLKDPTEGIEPYPSDPHLPWPDHVLAAALTHEDRLFRLAVKLHYYTGQRTGDVCRMAWATITADGRIPVKQQKTGTALLIPMHPDLKAELDAAPRKALTILTNRTDGALRPGRFRTWVGEFAAAHGVHLVPHGLRKNAVNGLLDAECSTAEVSSITGQSLAMVEHYAQHRNRARTAVGAVLKWGRHEPGTGKLSANGKTGSANN